MFNFIKIKQAGYIKQAVTKATQIIISDQEIIVESFQLQKKSFKISTVNNLVPRERKALVKGKSISVITKNTNSTKSLTQSSMTSTNNSWPEPSVPSFDINEEIPPLKKKSLSAKVVISNLHPTVTQEDILELFGAIGPLQKGCLQSVGTAEVVYYVVEDAFAAFNKYHGRNLDGQPMILKITTVDNDSSIDHPHKNGSSSSFYHQNLGASFRKNSLARPVNSSAPVVFTVKL